MRETRSAACLLLAASLLSACDQLAAPPGPAARLEAASPVAIQGTVGATVPDSLVVRVEDGRGRGVPGVEVTWSSSVFLPSPFGPAVSLTDERGLARTAWTLAPQAGAQTATARVVTTEGPATVTFTAEARPGPAATGTLTIPTAKLPVAGETVQLDADFRDPYGNRVGGRQASWASSRPAVAEVNPGGAVTARSRGRATITATLDSVTAALELTVGPLLFAGVSASFRDVGRFASTDPGARVCGATPEGEIYCWGDGVLWPARLSTDLHLAQASTGAFHTCAIANEGRAYCWGENTYGQLGTGTTTASATPTPVAGDIRFRSISAGYLHTCGVSTGGDVYCWGWNAWRQLGTEGGGSQAPRRVGVDAAFTSVSAGYLHTCGVAATGEAYCWGDNRNGQSGASDTYALLAPHAVPVGEQVAQVDAGINHTCAVAISGRAYCWGNAEGGKLGGSTQTVGCAGRLSGVPCSPEPVAVSSGLAWSKISAGGGHSCGLTTEGAAYCWGSNAAGQLGRAQSVGSSTPVPVTGGLVLRGINAGPYQSCALTAEGRAYCWGQNPTGQLGNGTTASSAAPVAVGG